MELSYEIGPSFGHRANFGLVVLRTDETIETELRRIVPDDGIAIHTTRIPCETEVNPEALSRMEQALPDAAALLPRSIEYDVIGYGCTSAATVIGSDRVADQIRRGARARHVTDPLTAVVAACRALGASNIGFLSPYVAAVSAAMREKLEAEGIRIASFGTFGEESDERIARIDPASTFAGALRIGKSENCDAIFMSCTNLRALEIIPSLEAELGIPVLSSNLALAWHMLTLAGVRTNDLPFGRLMAAG